MEAKIYFEVDSPISTEDHDNLGSAMKSHAVYRGHAAINKVERDGRGRETRTTIIPADPAKPTG